MVAVVVLVAVVVVSGDVVIVIAVVVSADVVVVAIKLCMERFFQGNTDIYILLFASDTRLSALYLT